MGTLVGHVAPGFGFFVIGLWHLVNHIKLQVQNPNSYKSLPWFPTSKIRHLELFLIMGGCTMSVAMELFIGPDRHQPLDPDGTIPSNHLHNFEHSSISITFFVYAAFALLLDKLNGPKAHHTINLGGPEAQNNLTQLLAGIAFGQQLLLFHLHSADHMGMEGQYHMLLQLLVLISLITTLMGIGYSKSFLISFVRATSLLFEGIWFMVMGFMLWTPGLIPKGCFLNEEEGHQVARCHGDEALERAKSLVNIQFSWYLISITIFAVATYIVMAKAYGEKVEYESLTKYDLQEVEGEEEEDGEDVEAQNKTKVLNESKSFLHMGKSFAPINMER